MLMFIFSIVLLFASYSLWKGFLAFEDVLDFNEEFSDFVSVAYFGDSRLLQM